MGFYNEKIVPRLITCACGLKPIAKQREKIVPHAHGMVLEIGLGAGHNLPYYDTGRVASVVGIDPCQKSWELAASRAKGLGVPLEFLRGTAEKMPLPDSCFDSVLMTYSLCTIPNPVAALAEVRRILKPGGDLIFCEHGQAPDTKVARWQHRINPWWKALFGGCNLNRRIKSLIGGAGFTFDSTEEMYLPGTPRILGFNIWGRAF